MRVRANDFKRCTVAFTITASREIIKPMVIYTGTRGGHIPTQVLPRHPQDIHYTVQKKAWFDEVTMLEWVEKVLAPDVAMAPVGIIPYSLIPLRFISLGVLPTQSRFKASRLSIFPLAAPVLFTT
jgi:hypothetical protein